MARLVTALVLALAGCSRLVADEPGAAQWKAVGKAAGRVQRGQVPGELWAGDSGPGVWYFASEGLLGCEHAPPGEPGALELQFQLGHLEFDARAQAPVAGVPDVLVRCHPDPHAAPCAGRGATGRSDEGHQRKMTVALFGVIDPWERAVYRVRLSAADWVNMESKRNATAEDMAHVVGCPGPVTLMIRGGHFAGAEAAVLQDVKISRASASAAAAAARTRTVLPRAAATRHALPPMEPSPLLHGREAEHEARQHGARARITEPAAGGGRRSTAPERGADERAKEQCFGVEALDAYATGTVGVVAVVGESLLLSTASSVRQLPLLSRPIFADEGGSASGSVPRRERLWRVIDEVLLIMPDDGHGRREEAAALEHIDLHEFVEEQGRRLIQTLDSKFAAHARTSSAVPSNLPDTVRHAILSARVQAQGERSHPGGQLARRPLMAVGSLDTTAQRLCVREGEGHAMWAARAGGGEEGSARVQDPLQSWYRLFEFLDSHGGWQAVLGTGATRPGGGSGDGQEGTEGAGVGFGGESIALWKARPQQRRAQLEDAGASKLQQHLREMLQASNMRSAAARGTGDSPMPPGEGQDVELVSELATDTCALAVTGDGRFAVLGPRLGETGAGVGAAALTVVPLSAVRHFAAAGDHVIRVMGSRNMAGGEGQGGGGVLEGLEEIGAEDELAKFSVQILSIVAFYSKYMRALTFENLCQSAGFHMDELARFFDSLEAHQRQARAPTGGAQTRKSRRLLADDGSAARKDGGGAQPSTGARGAGGLGHSGGGGAESAWSASAAKLVAKLAAAAALDPLPSREQIGYLVARSLHNNFGRSRFGDKDHAQRTPAPNDEAVARSTGASGENASGQGADEGGVGGKKAPEVVGEKREQEDDELPPSMRQGYLSADAVMEVCGYMYMCVCACVCVCMRVRVRVRVLVRGRVRVRVCVLNPKP
jgi:hypothetical protein